MSQSMRDTRLEKGEVLYRQGTRATQVHFVVNGRIELRRQGRAPWSFGAGALVGMFDASIPRLHPRTALASEPTQVLTLDFDDYLDIIEDNFGFAAETLRFGAREQHSLSLELPSSAAFSSETLGLEIGKAPLLADEPHGAIERLLVLRQGALFRAAPVQALASLARLSEVRRWRTGDVLFGPGDKVVVLQIVRAGEITVSHPDHGELGRFGPAGMVGGLEALGNDTHDCRAVATSATLTVQLDIEDLLDVAEDHFELCCSMLSFIARERARVTEELSEKRLSIERATI